jgi:hypothetical protein
MSLYQNKPFRILGIVFVLGFITLFMIRLNLLQKLFFRPQPLSVSAIKSPGDKETWMNILQNNRKIGFSHSKFSTEADGYRLQETVLMRINTMGMVQDINLKTIGRLNPDFSLAEFDFKIKSGRFSFNVNGSVSGEVLTVRTNGAATGRQTEIPLEAKPYLLPAITAAMSATELKTGDQYTFDIFDPATMGQTPVIVDVIGMEDLQIAGEIQSATKVALNFKGTSLLAWIGEHGDVLREKGILGLQLEKTTRVDALRDLAEAPSADLTQIASVASNVLLEDLDRLSTLRVEINGIPIQSVQLNGGRQTVKANILTIEKETTANLSTDIGEQNLQNLEKIFLKPGPFIQSDDQKIQALAQEIAGNHAEPLDKVRMLVDWVYKNIDKRPVLSLPDALSTLENRVGDCNEHAVLLAALARAAGIPCRVEAGLVYLKGRFYYHAWNLVYLGRWITVDAVFNQIPADVSHIRLATGSPNQQLDLMGVIGKLQLKVINPP